MSTDDVKARKQVAVDSFGNPINIWGLPLGKRPPPAAAETKARPGESIAAARERVARLIEQNKK
jgi:hypothetical protein